MIFKQVANRIFSILLISGTAAFSFACSPKVYLIDRQTILEEEAAGEWPDFEKGVIGKSSAQGPTPLVHVKENPKKDRLYKVLNSELSSKNQPNSTRK